MILSCSYASLHHKFPVRSHIIGSKVISTAFPGDIFCRDCVVKPLPSRALNHYWSKMKIHHQFYTELLIEKGWISARFSKYQNRASNQLEQALLFPTTLEVPFLLKPRPSSSVGCEQLTYWLQGKTDSCIQKITNAFLKPLAGGASSFPSLLQRSNLFSMSTPLCWCFQTRHSPKKRGLCSPEHIASSTGGWGALGIPSAVSMATWAAAALTYPSCSRPLVGAALSPFGSGLCWEQALQASRHCKPCRSRALHVVSLHVNTTGKSGWAVSMKVSCSTGKEVLEARGIWITCVSVEYQLSCAREVLLFAVAGVEKGPFHICSDFPRHRHWLQPSFNKEHTCTRAETSLPREEHSRALICSAFCSNYPATPEKAFFSSSLISPQSSCSKKSKQE